MFDLDSVGDEVAAIISMVVGQWFIDSDVSYDEAYKTSLKIREAWYSNAAVSYLYPSEFAWAYLKGEVKL